jgi:predicted nucleic acid-binding protein
MIIADSSVWIDYFRGIDVPHTNKLDMALGTDEIFMGDLIVTEIMQGARTEKSISQIKDVISKMQCVNMVGQIVAYQSAENYRFLRSKGITVRKTIDMLIGTYCIISNASLIHNDQDFDPMEEHLGLKVLK